ncbi:phosphate signaling complex protein PhoU [Marichromatium bheemlicum]|uniref:Phosphate-specific transport system accessory protein PhoU n=1 Tax=Marichromatium bheemlicum TaxID=365339 RepID=A0ABX1I9D0_9GAMM|nr:phosphate signaling complex protein PhoU [Marichromatium bheemlicum]NKN32950.1 phosphate signaling complex protein PhoU [Marichromatium bheemlicum]
MTDSLTLVQKQRAHLQDAVDALGGLALTALRRSVDCLERHDRTLAAQIVAADAEINQQRRLLEQECLVTLAAYKPAGVDLRAVGACMELAGELERIADYAADVARILLKHGETPFPATPVAAIAELARTAITMLATSLEVFTDNGDEGRARAAVAAEAQIDQAEHAFIEQVLEHMRTDPEFAVTGTELLWIVHDYERVADRATNIAERTIYVASGKTLELD